jgi:ABC-2 type transport system ATP-binding protein
MTVREYLMFVGKIKGITGDLKGRVTDVMKRTWVSDVADKQCGRLSKGYKQRVGLAQALIHEPEVLVLDEPTAGLDPKQIIETRQLIRELAGNHTIVLSTHILPEVAQTCKKIVIINKGRIVAVDTPEGLTEKMHGAVSIYVQAQGPVADIQRALQSVGGVSRVNVADSQDGMGVFEVDSEKGSDIRRELASAIVRGGWGLLELRPMRVSLEDVFVSLMTEDKADAPAVAAEAEAANA